MRYVKYIGLAHERVITPGDWRTVRENAGTVVWNAQNGFAVPLDVFTDEQLKKAIEHDPNFVITGADEDFEPTPMSQTMTPSALAQNAQQPVDVLALVGGTPEPSTDNVELSEGGPTDVNPPDAVPSDTPASSTTGGSKRASAK